VISHLRGIVLVTASALATPALAGGELTPGPWQMPAPRVQKLPAARTIEPSAIRPLYRAGDQVTRSVPLPAPLHPTGHGAELNDFYGPTYYYPSEHNMYEGLHPTYYPFLHPDQKVANYKAGGIYCPGQLCGSSRSHWYWDSYDDWVRGGRYGQHQ
jgi:hypothetical protein